MQVTLKDYQDEAARKILETLSHCAADYRSRKARKAFALSSTTGSGKTVIAAAVIESLLHGSTEFDVEADPGAVVLWISKDKSLNEQSRSRIMQVADRIPVGDLVMLDKDFGGDRLEKGTVYFINPAKLGSKGLFTRRTDERPHTFWDILGNTINDPHLMLYVILDEAHEGMRTNTKTEDGEDVQTVVQRIINGNGSHPPVPVVLGISATVDRFNEAMARITDRGTEPNVVIDPVRVQDSGLLKNTLVLDIPDEDGDFLTSMLRDATEEFVAVSKQWKQYGEAEGLEDPVLPLMVVQIPNKESGAAGLDQEDRTIKSALDVIRANYPDYKDDCVAHVIGDRKGDIEIGDYTISHIQPQDVQDATHIRILIAKDAVSTGWDCPRAEILYSMRKSDKENRTYIAQLLGRMVRTPLARSTSDDRLNSSSCFLPRFDGPAAKSIAEEIMGIKEGASGGSGSTGGTKVIFRPVDLVWNDQIEDGYSDKVKDALTNLPSYAKPSIAPKPIRRALSAAVALATDDLVAGANKSLLDDLCGVLAGAMTQYKDDVDQIAKDIMDADVKRFTASHGDEHAQEDQITRQADENTVKEAFGSTSRAFTSSVAKAYLKRLYEAAIAAHGIEADLVEIQSRVAALSRITRNGEPVVVKALEDAADKQTRAWLDDFEDQILLLSDERQAVYEDIRGQAREPELVKTQIRPVHRVEGGKEDGSLLETRMKHVLSDGAGEWPLDPSTNEWERFAIDKELQRNTVVAWYRNPSDAGKFSVKIPYRFEGSWKSLQPDFIFLDKDHAGDIRPSIVDPHGGHLKGALERLVGIAEYAEKHGGDFARIVCIDEDKDKKFRSLNMADESVRKAVLAAPAEGKTATDLFNGPLAKNYR